MASFFSRTTFSEIYFTFMNNWKSLKQSILLNSQKHFTETFLEVSALGQTAIFSSHLEHPSNANKTKIKKEKRWWGSNPSQQRGARARC